MSLGIEGSPTAVGDGSHRAVRLLLFERGTKNIDAGVAVYVE